MFHKLIPKEFVTVLIPKYEGNYKTKLRLRFSNGENLYISEPFEGVIDKKQFLGWKNYRNYKYDASYDFDYAFYGARPFMSHEGEGEK